MADILFLKLLLFVPVVVLVYWLLPRRLQNYWLLVASYGFYISWQWSFGAILLLVTLVNFVLARELESAARGRRALLWGGIAFNVLSLLTLKYPRFVFNRAILAALAPVLDAAGLPALRAADIVLPLGLSFTVLQMISYLVDVYRGQMAASDDLVDFALYAVYFPKLLSGPIERASSFLPRLAQARTVDPDGVARSVTLIFVGLFRKLVVANPLFEMAPTTINQSPGDYPAPVLTLWLLAYSFALYNDFAGYTDLMRGVSGLLGIELTVNFKQPYFARTFTEFWNQWHITLSHWLRDYIFFPLSRALLRRNPGRRNLANLIVPPMITMLVSGFWHGVSAHLIVWGAIHGVYLVVERIPSLWRPVVPPQKWPWWRQTLGRVVVFALAILAWIPFHLSLPAALDYVRGMGNWSGNWFVDVRVLILIIPAHVLDWLQYHFGETVFLRWPRLAKSAVMALAILAILIVLRSESAAPPFVYQGF